MKKTQRKITTITLLIITVIIIFAAIVFLTPKATVSAEVISTDTSKTISNENRALDSNYGGTNGSGNYPKIQDITYSVTFSDQNTAYPKAKVKISYKYVYNGSGLKEDTSIQKPATIPVGYGMEMLIVDGALKYEKSGDRRANGITYSLPEQTISLAWNKEYSIEFRYYRHYKTLSNDSKIVTTLRFSIKLNKDAPKGTLSGVSNGGSTNGSVSFYFDSATCSALHNDSQYINGASITGEGVHTIKLTNLNDAAGRNNTYTFTIDKTKPTMRTETGKWGYTNKTIAVYADDDRTDVWNKIYCRKPGGTWEYMGTNFTVVSTLNGEWLFYAVDEAGNQSDTYSIILDDVAPNIGLRKTDGTAFADGSWVNQGVYFDVTDSNDYSVSLYRNASTHWEKINSNYITGTIYFDKRDEEKLFGSRAQALSAIEEAEFARVNSRSGWKTIPNDTRIIAPGQIDYVLEGADYWEYTLSSGEVYVFFVQSDINPFVKNKASSYIGSQSRDMFLQEGNFKVMATDAAGNITEKTFSIKTTLPVPEIVPFGYTNSAIRYRVVDPYELQTWMKVNNGDWALQDSSDLTIAPNGGDGTYYFKTLDVAGNIVSASVVLDTHAPTLASSDVAAEGYINRRVSITVSDINLSDVFYRSLGGEWLQGGMLLNIGGVNGVWEAYAIDRAGNRSDTFSFTYDDVAPSGAISKLDGTAAGAFYNAAVRFTGVDETLLERLEVFAPGKSWTSFDGALPELVEGIWQFRSLDAAGNYSLIYSIEIDLTAPGISMRKNGNSVSAGFYTKANDELTYQIADKNALGIELDGVRLDSLPNNSELSDAEHWLVALDKAGNRSEPFLFIVDKILPTVSILALSGAALSPADDGRFYTNAAVRVEGADAYFAALCVYKGEELVFDAEVETTDFAAISANFGVYRAYAIDMAGNRSAETSFIIQIMNDFGNLDNIYRSFKINAWYDVTLPSYVFGTNPTLENIAGRYSFERREDAYAWACAVEELYRVQKQGDSWIYVSATNEAVAQIYTSREDLEKVIAKYASRYVGGRKVAPVNGNENFNIIKDPDGRTDESAFVRQNVERPSFLSEYSTLELVQIKKDYAFSRLKSSLSPTSVKLTYLSDDFGPVTSVTIEIGYGESVKDALGAADALKQGYYLAEESDLCGNAQRYLIYIDLEAPKIRAEVELGDHTKKELVFDGELSAANAGVFYYLSFDVIALMDNVDDFLALRIEGRGASGLYVAGDELPTLNAELGGGQYVLTIYDRSGNAFVTKINIANKAPSMDYNSLRPTNRQLTLAFRTNDALNSITKLEIFKINGAGDRVKLERDDLGVVIDFTTLEYNFTMGGKFLAVITDRYGRVVETAPIFYERGLPYGELSVSAGDTTNKDVTFRYAVGNAVVVYVYGSSGEKEIYTDFLSVYDNIGKQYELTFLASGGIEKQYLIYLYSEADDNLFMEYEFGIDTVIADVTAQTDQAIIEKGGYTNKPFTLWWTEANVRVKYTIGDDGVTHTYERGETLTSNGLYSFSVTDRVGNTESFEIFLDNVVEYTLTGDGRIVNIGGKYLSNAAVTVKMNETFSEWTVADGKTVSDGVPIALEGIYSITIADRFGNRITLIIEIDLTPPKLTLEGVSAGGITKEKVTAGFEDGAKCYLMRNGIIVREVANGEEFFGHGAYVLRAEDLAGNASEIQFSIDLRVEYVSDVLNYRITTDPVSFRLSEDGSVTVMRDGQAVEAADSYSDVGVYSLTATDAVGNTMTFGWTILPKNAQKLTVKLASEHRVDGAKLNGNDVDVPYSDDTKKELSLFESGNWEITIFDTTVGQSFSFFVSIDNIVPIIDIVYNKNNTVSFAGLNKSDVTVTLTCDGKEIKWSQALVLKDPGHYVLTLTDSFGNANVLEFDIQYKLSTLSIVMIVLGCLGITTLLVLLSIRRIKIKVN